MSGLSRKSSFNLFVGALALSLALVVLLVVISSAAAARPADVELGRSMLPQVQGEGQQARAAAVDPAQASYVFRFDPQLESFETFLIPTANAYPKSVDVVADSGVVDVWFTEPEADQIGRLVYTATNQFKFHEYGLTAGSKPLQLVQDGAYVWFTAQKGNYIGRIRTATGGISKYSGLTAASRPTGIDVAPNGDIWFTEIDGDKIGRLEASKSYALTEYPINATGVRAYGVAVQSDQYVWFGETATGRAKRLKVADGSFISINVDFLNEGSYPFDLLYDTGRDYVWLTSPKTDRLIQLEVTTLSLGNQFAVPGSGGWPSGMDLMGNDEFWFTKYSAGQIARMVYTSPVSFEFDAFDLPVEGLLVADIASSADGTLWVVAHPEYQAMLPAVSKNFNPGPPSLFGIQMYGTGLHSRGLAEVAEAGARWVRVPAMWDKVEPADVDPEQYNWKSIDSLVTSIVDEGIEPLLTLGGNPEWVATYAMGPVNDIGALKEFVGALVERYDGDGVDDALGSPVVRYLEIYNEPDNFEPWRAERGGYGAFGNRGPEYAATLDAIYPVIKAANAEMQVVFGGLGYDDFDFEGGAFDSSFVEDVLSNCTGPCFDVMNFHYFPFYRERWEPYGKDVIGKANYLRSVLAKHGFDRPLMCTETSWPQATVWGSSELQARYVVAAMVRGFAADLVTQSWYAWMDVDSGLPGILDDKLNPKRAYFAYQTAVEQLDGAEFVRAFTPVETGDPDLEGYSFSVPAGGKTERRDVYWLDCPSYRVKPPQECWPESRTMTLPVSAVRRIDLLGMSTVVNDGDDGQLDGAISLTITPDPIYIDFTP
jgi:streptogramin lyase